MEQYAEAKTSQTILPRLLGWWGDPGLVGEAMIEADDTGTFDEMVTLASERALADGSVVVIHRQGCDGADDCLCQPRIVRPYEPVTEPPDVN